MVGLTLAEGIDAAAVRDRCLGNRLVLNSPGLAMLRMLPPLVVGNAELDEGLGKLSRSLG